MQSGFTQTDADKIGALLEAEKVTFEKDHFRSPFRGDLSRRGLAECSSASRPIRTLSGRSSRSPG